MYKAWYRKWRPTTFDEVCGQNQVTDILKYQVANHKASHAYLFCGSRGTGKTSCAKILARALNCESPQNGNPCNNCYACKSILNGTTTDVIEIDAASNNGVDNVRDIKEEIHFTPAELSYRVYIIDEVHMMSPSAFNALLKTLEEPPAHAVFVLATTELHKLPSTIISRCQRYDFRRLPSAVLVDRMKEIARVEKIDLTDDGALVIARMAQGGMRDTVSLLELCAGMHTTIDEKLVTATLGAGSRNETVQLVQAVANKNYDAIFSKISEIVMDSRDLSVFWQELIDTYRDIAVVKTSAKAKEYLDLTDLECRVLKECADRFSMETLIYHSKLLEDALTLMQRVGAAKRSCAEMALLRMCEPKLSASPEAMLARISDLEESLALMKLGISPGKSAENEEKTKAEQKNLPDAKVETETRVPDGKVRQTEEIKQVKENTASVQPLSYWQDIVERLVEQKGALSGFLQNSSAYTGGERGFVIRAATPFAAKMLSRPDVITMMQNLISTREGKNISALPFAVVAEGQKTDDPMAEVEAALKQ